MMLAPAAPFALSPPPDQASSLPMQQPIAVHRLHEARGGLKGAAGAQPTAAGLLVWGDDDNVTMRGIARVDVDSGRQERLYTERGLLTVWPSESGLWFTQNNTGPKRLLHLDAASGAVVDLEATGATRYGAAWAPVQRALREVEPQRRALNDGTLLLEWRRYEPIPILLGQTRAHFGLREGKDIPDDPSLQRDVYTRVWLPPPSSADPLRVEVNHTPVLRSNAASRIEGDALPPGVAPVSLRDGHSGNLTPVAASSTTVLQPFELKRHPQNYAPCAPGSDVLGSGGGIIVTSSMSNDNCARICGVHVEDPAGRWVRSLTHGVGMPGEKAVDGDTLLLSNKRDTATPTSVSVWRWSSGALVARLALPADLGRQTNLVFLQPQRDPHTHAAPARIVAVTSYPRASVVVWAAPGQ